MKDLRASYIVWLSFDNPGTLRGKMCKSRRWLKSREDNVEKMTDLFHQFFSAVSFLLEETLNVVNSFRYVPAILANTSTSYLFYIGLSVVMIVITFTSNKKSDQKSSSKNFDISPEDEVIFESKVTQEEIDAAIKKNTPGTYIPLSRKDGDAAKGQIDEFLDRSGDRADLIARVKKARQTAIEKKIKDEMSEEDLNNEYE